MRHRAIRHGLTALLFGITLSAGTILPCPATAAPDAAVRMVQPIIDALKRQGYAIDRVSTTWLNRVQIDVSNGYVMREIVVSPASGDVLRDVVLRRLKPLPSAPPEDQSFIPLPGGNAAGGGATGGRP